MKVPKTSDLLLAQTPKTPSQEAAENAKEALGRAKLHALGVGGAGLFTGLGYLGYKVASEGPLDFLIPDNPNILITALFAALTLGFLGAATKNVANAARWATVAGARRLMPSSRSKGAPLQ